MILMNLFYNELDMLCWIMVHCTDDCWCEEDYPNPSLLLKTLENKQLFHCL